MSFCILLDHFRTVKNLNKRRLEEVRSDERKMVGKVVVVTGSNSGNTFGTTSIVLIN